MARHKPLSTFHSGANAPKARPLLQKKGEVGGINFSMRKGEGWGETVFIRLVTSEIFRLINSSHIVGQG